MDAILKKALFLEFIAKKSEALTIYKYLLKKDRNSKEANLAINRLAGNRKKFLGVDKKKKDFVIKSKFENIVEFEQWLIEI